MKRYFTPAAFAAAILLSGVSADAILAPVAAQGDVQIGFDTFHDQLAAYGDWVYSDRWGEVWIPSEVPDNFQPYGTNGYWADTDEYGWTWVSNYEWGDIPFHYGRWVNDPDDGWLWIPGYVWSPAWVVFRSNGQYTGWMPTPPDPEFLQGGGPAIGVSLGGGIGVSVDFGNTGGYYGYSQWYGPGYDENSFASNWVFVGTGHLADRDFSRYQAPRAQYATFIRTTTNITNYTVVNNYIVNRSVDPSAVQRAGGHAVVVVHVTDVIKKPQFITRADQGREVQEKARQEMPRGTGTANSAPKPSPKVVQSLSTKVTPRPGHPAAHLYTRETVTNAPLPAKRGGPAEPARATGAPKETGPHGATPPASGEKPMDRERPSTTGPAKTPTTVTPESTRHRENEANPTPPAAATPETTRRREDKTATPTKPVEPKTPAEPETTRHHGNEALPESKTSAPTTPAERERTERPATTTAPTKPVESVKPKAVTPPPPTDKTEKPEKPEKPEKKVKPDDDKPQ